MKRKFPKRHYYSFLSIQILICMGVMYSYEAFTSPNISLEKNLAEKEYTLEVSFFDNSTVNPLEGVEVIITNIKTNNSTKLITGETGVVSITLRDESIFSVLGIKSKYYSLGKQNVSTIGRASKEVLKLDVPMQELAIGGVYELQGVDFKINEPDILPNSAGILHNLYLLLLLNPNVVVELECHTDARGRDDYNLELSQKRAEEIVQILINKGISEKRIIPKGYGETQLLNGCTNGVRCSQKLHEKNRRIGFKILSL